MFGKILIFFNSYTLNLDCGYMLGRFQEAVLTSTHNLSFGSEIREIDIYPCKPQFYCIKAGFKGVYISRICFPDEIKTLTVKITTHVLSSCM